jgi:hypothetical protein
MNREYYPTDIISPLFSIFIYHLGIKNRPVDGRSSEKYSHLIDMIIIVGDNMFSGSHCGEHED